MQELTNDKPALIASLEKLNFLNAEVADPSYPPMTEGQAFMIEQNDENMILYFLKAMGGVSAADTSMNHANMREVRNRASRVAAESATIGERTLSGLHDFVDSSAALPGRKAIFFLSDGFVLQTHRSNIVDRLRQITDAAARVGIVIYSLDTRGLVIGLPDATGKRAADMYGYLAKSGYSEVLPQQDALSALALDTGGRFLRNTNALDTALITTMTETSRYYLLGWYIDPEKLQPGRYSTIRVTVKGRRGATARVRQGVLDLSKLVSRDS
jgi:VWFA-related protein